MANYKSPHLLEQAVLFPAKFPLFTGNLPLAYFAKSFFFVFTLFTPHSQIKTNYKEKQFTTTLQASKNGNYNYARRGRNC